MNHFSSDRGFSTAGSTAWQSRSWLRAGALVLGLVLAVQAAWILVPEILRPTMPFFPATSTAARALAARHSQAAFAAAIGWPRGDLWTDKALTGNAALVSAFEHGTPSRAPAASSATAQTAATLAPADARAWLLLAMDSAQAHKARALAQLKMSYYTAPYNAQLFPLRIQVAAQLPILSDKEIKGFLRYELKTIIQDEPEMRPSIASAFHAGTPASRQFLEATLKQLDPTLLNQARSANP